ncbi:AIG2-like protein [Zea mays]|uniref:Putative gamma-glutamylcyclotransferase n=1 Tax=Zea mays TaxID=4577 RepID=A0A1D6H0C5_MAIZE|nr:AIG2-like protein [Zea mays]
MASPPPVATAGPHSVFVYGTLMEEEVVRVLLGRAPPSSSPALLPDHRRFSLRGRVYPAILPARAHAVSGKVIQGLTDRELHVFDMFEDEEYVKTTVEVSLTEWRKVHLKYYLEMTREFMLELGQF